MQFYPISPLAKLNRQDTIVFAPNVVKSSVELKQCGAPAERLSRPEARTWGEESMGLAASVSGSPSRPF